MIAAVYWDYFSEGEDTDANVDFTNIYFLVVINAFNNRDACSNSALR